MLQDYLPHSMEKGEQLWDINLTVLPKRKGETRKVRKDMSFNYFNYSYEWKSTPSHLRAIIISFNFQEL